ncbi:hypothetical protein ONZ45_g6895 [Pleurotus djamor]|nr:hypothetical protein ONZ45_g6895 [Pleurotus djamor]
MVSMGGVVPSQRGRTEFTVQDDRNLVKYLAGACPDLASGGRLGMIVYEELMSNVSIVWRNRHTAHSWRERYKKNRERFDAEIAHRVATHPPPPEARDPRDRRANNHMWLLRGADANDEFAPRREPLFPAREEEEESEDGEDMASPPRSPPAEELPAQAFRPQRRESRDASQNLGKRARRSRVVDTGSTTPPLFEQGQSNQRKRQRVYTDDASANDATVNTPSNDRNSNHEFFDDAADGGPSNTQTTLVDRDSFSPLPDSTPRNPKQITSSRKGKEKMVYPSSSPEHSPRNVSHEQNIPTPDVVVMDDGARDEVPPSDEFYDELFGASPDENDALTAAADMIPPQGKHVLEDETTSEDDAADVETILSQPPTVHSDHDQDQDEFGLDSPISSTPGTPRNERSLSIDDQDIDNHLRDGLDGGSTHRPRDQEGPSRDPTPASQIESDDAEAAQSLRTQTDRFRRSSTQVLAPPLPLGSQSKAANRRVTMGSTSDAGRHNPQVWSRNSAPQIASSSTKTAQTSNGTSRQEPTRTTPSKPRGSFNPFTSQPTVTKKRAPQLKFRPHQAGAQSSQVTPPDSNMRPKFAPRAISDSGSDIAVPSPNTKGYLFKQELENAGKTQPYEPPRGTRAALHLHSQPIGR